MKKKLLNLGKIAFMAILAFYIVLVGISFIFPTVKPVSCPANWTWLKESIAKTDSFIANKDIEGLNKHLEKIDKKLGEEIAKCPN